MNFIQQFESKDGPIIIGVTEDGKTFILKNEKWVEIEVENQK